jgi:hypothetical protein
VPKLNAENRSARKRASWSRCGYDRVVPTPKLKSLYKRVGPTLFARAQRALKDDGAAQEMVQEVVIELSRLGEMTDAELLTMGRDILKKRLKKRGSDVDSMTPETE